MKNKQILSYRFLLCIIFFSNISLFAEPSNDAVIKKAGRIIQPNYQKWGEIKKGLSVQEVEKLLGKPLTMKKNTIYYYRKGKKGTAIELRALYGLVLSSSKEYPQDINFVVWFENGKVRSKSKPFGDVPLSKDGTPTIPKLLYPYTKSVFTHFPQILDFRWLPSSGEYPMSYRIQVDAYIDFMKKWSSEMNKVENVRSEDVPHHCRFLDNFRKYRWRVKAVNKFGESKWSDYFYFEFTKDFLGTSQ